MTKMSDVPSMKAAVAAIKPYLPLLFQAIEEGAIEEGTIEAKACIEEKGLEFEPGLHASFVRAYVWTFFKKNENTLPWSLSKLNNNGLQMQIADFVIRTRKATSGAIPHPTTKAFDGFLKQMTLGGDFDIIHNLLLLWETNKDGDLRGISLIYPLSATQQKWRYEVRHPLATGSVTSRKNDSTASSTNSSVHTDFNSASSSIKPRINQEDIQLIYQTSMLLSADLDDLPIEYIGTELPDELSDGELEVTDQSDTGTRNSAT